MNIRRILALLGVVFLVGLYVAAFILSFLNYPGANRLFLAAIICTIAIPIIIHLLLMMNNVRKGKSVMDEPYSYRDKSKDKEKDDNEILHK